MNIRSVTPRSGVPVEVAGGLIDDLRGAFASARHVRLDLSESPCVDLGLVQVVLAARAHADAEGIRFDLAPPAGAPLTALFERAGFLPDMSADDRSFWFHGDEAQ